MRKIEEASDQYSKKNPELQARSLLLLNTRISRQDTKEEILSKVSRCIPIPLLQMNARFPSRDNRGQSAEQVRSASKPSNAVRKGNQGGEKHRAAGARVLLARPRFPHPFANSIGKSWAIPERPAPFLMSYDQI